MAVTSRAAPTPIAKYPGELPYRLTSVPEKPSTESPTPYVTAWRMAATSPRITPSTR